MIRSMIAVITGFAVWSALWLGGGAALGAIAPDMYVDGAAITSPGGLAILLALSVVCSLASGFAAAVLRRERRWGAIFFLGVLLLAVGIAVQTQAWHLMPVWYHLTFLVLLMPATLLGAQGRFIAR